MAGGESEADGEIVRLERLTDEFEAGGGREPGGATPGNAVRSPAETVQDPDVAGPAGAPQNFDADGPARAGQDAGRAAAADPFAGLRSDVVAYGHVDPLETLRGLSVASGISVGALAHYVLARWASGGTEALLELGVSGVDHLARVIEQAEAQGSDAARLEAYESVREIIGWLRAGVDP